MDCKESASRHDEKHLSFGFGAAYIRDLRVVLIYKCDDNANTVDWGGGGGGGQIAIVEILNAAQHLPEK